MRLQAAIQGDLAKVMAAEVKAAERAVTAGVNRQTVALKTDLRRQIVSAGMGQRLANTWRGRVYPSGQPSISAAGWVWSKAPEIVSAHASGSVIRARRGAYLAIPLPAAGRAGRERMTPRLFEQQTGQRLRFVPRPRGGALLVLDRGRLTKRGIVRVAGARARSVATVPLFVLVPMVRLRKRFDVQSVASRRVAELPAAIAAEWRAIGV